MIPLERNGQKLIKKLGTISLTILIMMVRSNGKTEWAVYNFKLNFKNVLNTTYIGLSYPRSNLSIGRFGLMKYWINTAILTSSL